MITLLARDRQAMDAWHWLGFGLTTVDAIRDLTPVQETSADIAIRRAGLEDIEQAMTLDQALQRHLAAAPIFVIEEHAPPLSPPTLGGMSVCYSLIRHVDERVVWAHDNPKGPRGKTPCES